MKKIVLVSGKSGSGKDAFSALVKKELEDREQKVLIIHYADVLKHFLIDYYEWNGQKDETGRSLLQGLGTDTIRSKYPDFWCEIVGKFLYAINETKYDFDYVIIPDARFPNEIEVIEELNSNIAAVRIKRTDGGLMDYVNPKLTEAQRNHASETSLDHYSFDYIIHNDKDLNYLKECAIGFVEDIIKGENE